MGGLLLRQSFKLALWEIDECFPCFNSIMTFNCHYVCYLFFHGLIFRSKQRCFYILLHIITIDMIGRNFEEEICWYFLRLFDDWSFEPYPLVFTFFIVFLSILIRSNVCYALNLQFLYVNWWDFLVLYLTPIPFLPRYHSCLSLCGILVSNIKSS